MATDFSLENDLSTFEKAQFYHLKDEQRSKASNIYATGVILYQLFTGSLPSRDQKTSFVVRKSFTKLPDDIQRLIANIISTVPEGRESDSLQRAVELFQKHIQNKHHKTFTDKTSSTDPDASIKLQNPTATPPDSTTSMTYLKKPSISVRMGFLYGLLLLIFVQYLYLFDGQEKINQSLPEVYSLLVDHIEAFRTD
ncbi:MAG: hypothetical protein P8N94_15945 [Gammaproteobacteria bacterium]|nr:hypothetical protein [Gammaproteobacteria bacterium]MDG2339453.1 hypothetical protein [Gammaproteobacteria bacterium]